ncbi:hypothetical protein L6164_020615 [Bauhinia variegata]|uniref:Uncharacterized protein n=1 Tax=Bauhinia variegata TaxID=167791 RepID=A0ACB9MVL2_BAUVA|nr:hypothetical protein L6164_020615 [Bauhinia variegata]
MADSASSPAATLESNRQQSEPVVPNSHINQSDPVPASTPPPPTQPQSSTPSPAPITLNPNSNPPLPHTISYPAMPSFRPVAPQTPQFSPIPNPGGMPNLAYQNPAVPPPGVSSASVVTPGVASGPGAVPVSVPQVQAQMQPMMSYQVPLGQPPNPALRHYAPMPNGYTTIPAVPQGTIPPPGVPRYPHPYGTMVRPAYPPRPHGAVNVLPTVSRPPVAGIPGARPLIPPIARPVVAPSITPAEKPQTTVYVGKIASTVENDFMLSLLQLCGPVKSWKRPQDPSNGTPKSFGLCEFESAEGVLRALRLLSNLNIDGQELGLKVDEATRKYLERYVEKKAENSKKKESEAAGPEKDDGSAQPCDANEDGKPDAEHSKKEDNDLGTKENHDASTFGIVTDDDKEADQEALGKLTSMVEERLKTRPLPPPPAQAAADGSVSLASEQPAKARDGDTDVDKLKNEAAEDKHDKETNSDNKPTSEHDKPDTPDRRYDRKGRERDRERELKREKERELERYEREAEWERMKKEREQRRRIDAAEREYEARLKEWEYREKGKERDRQYEKKEEKERERKRRKEILLDEEDEDDDSRKRLRRSVLEEKRRKRLREKEDDLADRLKEEEEIAEVKRRAEEDQQQKRQRDALMLLSGHMTNVVEKRIATEEVTNEANSIIAEQDTAANNGNEDHIGNGNSLNSINDESTIASVAASDTRQGDNVPTKKLGFGLVGSGKRTTVPSVFHEEEDDDTHKDKKMRPLVPIDYSTEELQAVQPTASAPTPPNLAAAAEFAKRLSNANLKEEKQDGERDRGRRSNDKSNHRDRDKNDEDGTHNRDESKEKKLLDLKARKLIDTIPKTKEELFSYEINWAVYDKHQLHERMRPWISKKITEFLGEEETTLVDYIVSSMQEHVKASQMLDLLQSILDDEAEMFVLKMWRMLIFEIKKVEIGLPVRSKS